MSNADIKKMLTDPAQFENALRMIINQVNVGFYRYAKKTYGDQINDQDIEDVFQESLIVFTQKVQAHGIDVITTTPEGLIMGIGRIKWLEFFRKKEPYFIQLTQKLDVASSEEDGQLEEESERLKAAMDKLSPDCQKILKLKYWEKMKYAEIMKIQAIDNENNCKQRKHYCLQQLKKNMMV